MTNLERRRRRGDTLADALTFQLAACTEDAGLAAMVLADDDGLALASWGDIDLADEVAGRGPGALAAAAEERRLQFGGLELRLWAVGGEAQARRSSLERSASAVPRILGRWIAPSAPDQS